MKSNSELVLVLLNLQVAILQLMFIMPLLSFQYFMLVIDILCCMLQVICLAHKKAAEFEESTRIMNAARYRSKVHIIQGILATLGFCL